MGATEKELSGGEPLTTNNRMELTAVIEALNALKRPCEVKLSTDSRYVMDGLTKWIHGWQKNGWRTADKKPVKNAELWQALLAATKPHRIAWTWVKGHAGHPETSAPTGWPATRAARRLRAAINRSIRRAGPFFFSDSIASFAPDLPNSLRSRTSLRCYT